MFIQKILIRLILFSVVFSMGCKKKDLTNTTDITNFKWELKSIKLNGKEKDVPPENYFGEKISNDNPYMLIFENDSAFSFNLSINDGEGFYENSCAGIFAVKDYVVSKVCCDTDFDESLIELIRQITSYVVLEDLLILSSENGEIKLKKNS